MSKQRCYEKHVSLTAQSSGKNEIDLLFRPQKTIGVIESDSQIAIKSLRKLICELQTKSLRNKTRNKCKYFSL